MHLSVETFAGRLNEIMPVIVKEFTARFTKELHKNKITLPQFLVLEFLSRGGSSKMTELANFMNVTTAAMTGIVDRLVRDGYLKRVADCNDRRIIKVKLTDDGNVIVKKINERKRQMFIKVFGRISEEDRERYLTILKQIKDVLVENNI
ncbi:MAG: MarR family transcriptional regulator [Candidatus Omnitrophica bacterium]|nr:MarR family transcriptional regulator [Candidatus Omnitrophota bacterium]